MYVANANHGVSKPRASAPALREVLARCEPPGQDASLAAAQAILEALPVSAFIVDGAGRTLVANARGRGERAEGALDIRQIVEGRGDPAAVTLHPLPAGADGGARTLVLRRNPVASVAARIARAAALWDLTPCQTDVLSLLVHGEANKAIATARGCAVRTVEVHVTGLLAKSGTVSRAELVARFWTLG
jgi:DNA-binding CsgD family transcriptional regulator